MRPASSTAPAADRLTLPPRRDIDKLNEDWGLEDAIAFGVGQGGLPTCLITHPATGMQVGERHQRDFIFAEVSDTYCYS